MKKLVIGMLIISLSALIYSIVIEPFDLESTFHEINIGTSGKNFLVAHITDLHTDGLETLELKLIETIDLQRPDLILITGDITTPGGTIRGLGNSILPIRFNCKHEVAFIKVDY